MEDVTDVTGVTFQISFVAVCGHLALSVGVRPGSRILNPAPWACSLMRGRRSSVVHLILSLSRENLLTRLLLSMFLPLLKIDEHLMQILGIATRLSPAKFSFDIFPSSLRTADRCRRCLTALVGARWPLLWPNVP